MAAGIFRNKWLRIGIIFVAALVVLVLALPYLIPMGQFGSVVADVIERQTGRKAEVESLRLHVLPTINVEVVGFHLKNPQGFPEGDTVFVESVSLGAALWPLLEGKLEVHSISVDGVRLNLLEDERGRTNYDISFGGGAKKDAEGEGEAAVALTRIDSISVSDVAISTGSYHSGRKQLREGLTLSGLSAELLNLKLDDSGWLGKAEFVLPLAGVQATTPSLAHPVRVNSGEFTIRNGAGQGKFKASLDTITAEGSLKIPKIADPRAEFAVTVPVLDLGRLSALAGAESSGQEKDAAKRRPAPVTRKLLAAGSVKVNRVQLNAMHADNAVSSVRIYSHKLEVGSFNVDFYQGKLEGSVTLDTVAQQMPLNLTAKITGVDVGSLMKDAAPDSERTVTGTFAADASLGVSLGGDAMESASGDGNFAVRDGSFPGVDMRGNLVKAAKLLGLGAPEVKDTRFAFFGGDFRIADQRVHSKEIKLDSEALQATVHGSAGFDTTLDYKGTALLLTAEAEGQAAEQTAPAEQPAPSRNPLAGLGKAFGGVVQKTLGTASKYRIPLSLKGTVEDPKLGLAGVPQPVK